MPSLKKVRIEGHCIVPSRGEGVRKRCQMSQLKIPFYWVTLFWGEGIKLLFPFSFLYKEVERKLLMWVVKS